MLDSDVGINTGSNARDFRQPNLIDSLPAEIRANIKSLTEKTGSKTILKIPNGSGPYILRIGQAHGHPEGKGFTFIVNFVERNLIIDSQKRIERFLLSLIEQHPEITGVFAEGYVESDSKWMEMLVKIRQTMETNQACALSNVEALGNLVSVFHRGRDRLSKIFPGENRVLDSYDYIVQKKVAELLEYFSHHPPQLAREDREIFDTDVRQAQDILQFFGNRQLMGADACYLIGAPLKMRLDGRLKSIYPTSTPELSKRALDEFRRLSQTEDIKASEVLYRQREQTAISCIQNNPAVKSMKFIPLVYGSTHHFDNAVKEHNLASPTSTLGLIEISVS